MIDLAPFESILEHQAYCSAANTPFEDGAIGFKIFEDDEKLGLCQLKFVGEAAYVLAVTEIENKISVQTLASVFRSVVQFLELLGVDSVVYPIQNEKDVTIAQVCGFDRVSETLFVFDFNHDDKENDCDCGCNDNPIRHAH